MAVAAFTLPTLADHGRSGPLTFLGLFCLAAAAGGSPGPGPAASRTQRQAGSEGSPYRTPMLWRIHAASSLLVVPQFTIVTFALVFLVEARGWHAAEAGWLLAVTALCGAAVRLLARYWSDRVGSRLGPMRILAVATGLIVLAVAAGAAARSALAVVALLVAAVAVVSTNGLAFTAVAERAGLFLGGPGPGHPEHRPECVRGGHAAGGRRRDRHGRVPGRIRGRCVLPAGGGRSGAGSGGECGERPAGVALIR